MKKRPSFSLLKSTTQQSGRNSFRSNIDSLTRRVGPNHVGTRRISFQVSYCFYLCIAGYRYFAKRCRAASSPWSRTSKPSWRRWLV